VCSMSITLQVIFLLAIDVMVEGYTTSTSFCRHLGHICMLWSFLVFFLFLLFFFHTTSTWSMCWPFFFRCACFCFVLYFKFIYFYDSFILQVDWCLLLQFRKEFEGASSFLYTHGDVYCVIVKKKYKFLWRVYIWNPSQKDPQMWR
jgi:hypothetical protein